MAEENGEVDRDLPPIGGHRLLNELGSCWSTIAVEKRQNLKYSEITNVIVLVLLLFFFLKFFLKLIQCNSGTL